MSPGRSKQSPAFPANDTNSPAATSTDVYNQAILLYATGLDPTHLTYSVTWNTSNDPYHTTTLNGLQVKVANTVTGTTNYQWIPDAFLGGITLSSTSVSVMSY
jgi:hypothetical protein